MKSYESLLEYYRKCFSLVDSFHFNSSVAKKQYDKVLNIADATQVVLPITHTGIQDHREHKCFDSNVLRLGFVGHETPYKGLPLLKNVLGNIDVSKWRLDVWGGRIGQDENLPVFYRGKFNQKNISQVYAEMDLLVVPSVWQETFSLVTLEALSYGVPVLASSNVGAKDVVKEYDSSFIYESTDELLEKLEMMVADRGSLRVYNQAILQKEWRHDMRNHASEVIKKIYEM